MKNLLIAFLLLLSGSALSQVPEYSIQAIRYATAPNVEVADLVMGAPKDEKVNIAMVVWLIRGGGRNILFDSGFSPRGVVQVFPDDRLHAAR